MCLGSGLFSISFSNVSKQGQGTISKIFTNKSSNLILRTVVEFRYQELVTPLPSWIKASSCSNCPVNVSCFRPQYYKIIEECVSQIVLHCSGTDPDFKYRGRMDVNFTHLVGLYSLSSFILFFYVFFCLSFFHCSANMHISYRCPCAVSDQMLQP